MHRNKALNMSRHIIVAILMLFVLGYGTAWAFEGHEIDIAEHTHATPFDSQEPHADNDDCDHCCHAGAHLIGFVQQRHGASPVSSQSTVDKITAIFLTRATAPPIKPPRS